VAVSDGRRVEIGSLVIHASASDQLEKLHREIDDLKQMLEASQARLTEEQVLLKLPAELKKETLNLSIAEMAKWIQNTKIQHANIETLHSKLEQVEKVDGTFLYKLLIFNQDAACYGATLNFTAGGDRNECLPKAQLAERFLQFLSEIDFYVINGTDQPAQVQAKQQLLRLQDKYQFNTKGWYGPDVFNSIISEFYNKGDAKVLAQQ
jgi:regulator of replication initiation timing